MSKQNPKATRPKAAAGSSGADTSRRPFLSWMSIAWMAFTASMLAAGTATARFMCPNVLFEPPSSFKAGQPDEFQVGAVDGKAGLSLAQLGKVGFGGRVPDIDVGRRPDQFSQSFHINSRKQIEGSQRTLYLMETR